MGLEVPISVSMKLGDINNLFRRIVEVAQRPHLSIPETELRKNTKQHQKLFQRSLSIAVGMFLSLALKLSIFFLHCMMLWSVLMQTLMLLVFSWYICFKLVGACHIYSGVRSTIMMKLSFFSWGRFSFHLYIVLNICQWSCGWAFPFVITSSAMKLQSFALYIHSHIKVCVSDTGSWCWQWGLQLLLEG